MKWVDVTTGVMPEHNQQVWVFFQWTDGETAQGYSLWDEEVGWYMELENSTLLSQKRAIELGLDVAEITHWMPLPENPV